MYSFHKIGTINENVHRVLIHESDCDIIINWVGLTQPERGWEYSVWPP